MIRKSRRLELKKRARKSAGVKERRTTWLRQRGRMIFLDEVEKRSENGWIDGPEERSDYWKRGDVI